MQKTVVNVEPGIFFVVPISYLKFILDLRKFKVLLVFPAGRTGRQSFQLIGRPGSGRCRKMALAQNSGT
jgi:hypothetical protein